MNSPHKIVLRITWIGSLLLFSYSLTQECYCTSTTCLDSAFVLGVGWFGTIIEFGSLVNWLTEILSKHHSSINEYTGATFAWLANPFLFISWFSIKRRPTLSLMASILAVIAAISFLFYDRVMHNDIGHYSKIIEYKLGYWVWLASIIYMLVGIVVLQFIKIDRSKL